MSVYPCSTSHENRAELPSEVFDAGAGGAVVPWLGTRYALLMPTDLTGSVHRPASGRMSGPDRPANDTGAVAEEVWHQGWVKGGV